MTRYVCSQCGYARGSAKAVVEHIDRSHESPAHVMEYEPDDDDFEPEPGRLVRWLRRLLR